VIPRPNRVVKIVRTGSNGVERVVWDGYIAEVVPEGDHARVEARPPESLVTNHRPIPFEPPMNDCMTNADPFAFHWKKLDDDQVIASFNVLRGRCED
jgi:hypothetical protein